MVIATIHVLITEHSRKGRNVGCEGGGDKYAFR